MEKTVLFAFRGDPLCFVHVLLNALDLKERGQEGLIVFRRRIRQTCGTHVRIRAFFNPPLRKSQRRRPYLRRMQGLRNQT